MTINRAIFFAHARETVFRGALTQSQVDGISALLDAWEAKYPNGDIRWLSYELGTTFHETAATMQPISEYGHGAGRPYGHPDPTTRQVYYGRGFVQLTWKANYEAMSAVVGDDLVNDPALALEPDIAAKIMFYGMEHGSFTGRKLADYFAPQSEKSDWINARRIINGTDCAAQIATYGQEFFAALIATA